MHDDVKIKSRTLSQSAPVTAHDVARRTGVSQATVSRILSNSPKHRFAAETRRRVMEEAEKMGYQPHAVGRSLRERCTRVVGFYSGAGHLDARNAFLSEIIGGLQRGACETGYAVLLQNFRTGTPVGEIFGELNNGRVDGLIVHTRADDPLVERLEASSLPTIAVADAIPALPSVVVNDEEGIRQVIAHLTERGHRRIAFQYPTTSLASVEARMVAFREEMERRDLSATCIPTTFEDAEPVLDAVRQMSEPPTAICCWNDLSAVNLIHACHRRGMHVPNDLAIVGFDGLLDARFTERAITTVAAHWPDVARAALTLLLNAIRGAETPLTTTLPVALRVGETT